MFFDAKEFHTSNKQVANILSQSGTAHANEGNHNKTPAANVENANWGDDDELDIDADDMMDNNAGGAPSEN